MQAAGMGLAVVLSGVFVQAPPASSGTALQQTSKDPPTIIRVWLECDECKDGELEAVRNLGQQAVPLLAATLQNGPSPERRDAHRKHLLRRYDQLTAYAKTHKNASVPLTQTEFVNRYMDKFESLQRMRSARALATIGGAEARSALDKALTQSLRPEVLRVVKESLTQIKG